MKVIENACRHYCGMGSGPSKCEKGHDIRKMAIDANNGSNLGIGLRLPCTRQAVGGLTPLFECLDLDRYTDEEVQQGRQQIRDAIDRLVKAGPFFEALKDEMLEQNDPIRQIGCPLCGQGQMVVRVAIGFNEHMNASCDTCHEGFME